MPINKKPRSYNKKTIELLWSKSGGLCAFPGCPHDLVLRASNDIVGDIAHIVAYSPDWTRGDANFPRERINDYDNLILLCGYHHDLVDVKDSAYTVENLVKIKCDHERRVEQALRIGKPWTARIYHLYYVNVPRLSILSGVAGIVIPEPFLEDVTSLHGMGYKLSQVLASLEKIISVITPLAVPLTEFSSFSDDDLCKYCSFTGRFRTRNGPSVPARDAIIKLTGSLKVDPYIYQKINDWKFILAYDPAWVTTSTSFVDFSPTGGSNAYSGLCVIKRIDPTAKEVYATPLIIGIPRTPSTDLMIALSGG